MNAKGVVALSLLWTGLLVVLSRGWLGDVRTYVESVTGKTAQAPTPPASGAGPR